MKRKNSPSHHHPLSWPSVILGGVLLFLSAQVISAQLFFNGGAQRRTKALANAKLIAGGLLVFKSEMGAYPCDATRKVMEEDGIKNLPVGKSANAYLAQLISSEAIDSEKAFHTPEKGFKKGDDDTKTSKTLLAPGENGFAYIMAKGGKPLTDTRAFTPIILATIGRKGEGEPVFNADIYGGKFVMARVDGSAGTGDLNEKGHLRSSGRDSFFQTGRDSLFGVDIPELAYPLRPAKK
ncbi:hypothetical protein N9Z23_01735 [Akkermansiaceae bacterium]|nr:hypothetical protein [Akkermansiaceae bacterium]